MPTETVYGLAADATNPQAVAKVFAVKDRPEFNPLIVHVRSVGSRRRHRGVRRCRRESGEGLLAGAADAGRQEARRRYRRSRHRRVGHGRGSRPGPSGCAALLAAVPFPLVAPSANRSHHVSATSADHVIADLGDRVAIVLDAGSSPLGLESTIVQIGGGGPALLRPGAVTEAQLEQAIGGKLQSAAKAPTPVAPGMLARHYAPAVPIRLDADAARGR